MRLTKSTSVLLGALVLLLVTAFAGCENPFDPVNKSDKIEGLSYIDFTLTWDRWDSDPEYDGSGLVIDYYNEFGDSLSFHDKSHEVAVEFWSQKDVSLDPADPTKIGQSYDQKFYTATFEHSNSDDTIRIPRESYEGLMRATSTFSETEDYKAYVVVRVRPPQSSPKPELVASYLNLIIWKPVEAPPPPTP
jgi:hypothetical protein